MRKSDNNSFSRKNYQSPALNTVHSQIFATKFALVSEWWYNLQQKSKSKQTKKNAFLFFFRISSKAYDNSLGNIMTTITTKTATFQYSFEFSWLFSSLYNFMRFQLNCQWDCNWCNKNSIERHKKILYSFMQKKETLLLAFHENLKW